MLAARPQVRLLAALASWLRSDAGGNMFQKVVGEFNKRCHDYTDEAAGGATITLGLLTAITKISTLMALIMKMMWMTPALTLMIRIMMTMKEKMMAGLEA